MPPLAFLPVRRVMVVLIMSMAIVVLASLPAPFLEHVLGYDPDRGFIQRAKRLFDLNGEANLPAWFSSSILLISALLLVAIGVAERGLGRAYSRHWIGLGAVFVFLSLDEAAELHEQAGTVLGRYITTGGVLYFTWVLLGATFVLVIGLLYLGFLRALPHRTRNLFIAAGAIFVSGALGLEMVAGYYADTWTGYWASARRVVLTHTEEVMEMSGVLLFIYALLDYWRAHVGVIGFSVEVEPALRGAATSDVLTQGVVAGRSRWRDWWSAGGR